MVIATINSKSTNSKRNMLLDQKRIQPSRSPESRSLSNPTTASIYHKQTTSNKPSPSTFQQIARAIPTNQWMKRKRLALRGVSGSPQYAAVNTRPDISSKLSFLQSAIDNAKVETLQEANKLLHEAKKHHQVTIIIKPVAPKDFRLMTNGLLRHIFLIP